MSAYLATRMGRFTTYQQNRPLTDDEIRAVAPSVFAVEPHTSRSERYAYIPTSVVLARLRDEGFQPFSVSQARTRSADRREHTRHMMRLRHATTINNPEAVHEIVLANSHDGTSSYQMIDGMFRFVCANGLVCGDVENDIRIRHKGDIADSVIEGAYTVLNRGQAITDQMEAMRSITLNYGEQLAFARAARAVRFDDASPITEAQVLQPHRVEDNGSDLWRVLNRAQENLVRGGMDGRNANNKVRKVRAVTGIAQSTSLNRGLWILGQEMARLKG